MIIDAKDLIFGRMASVVAKRAILGEEVHIVNAEQAVISGSRDAVLARFMHMRFGRTTPRKGPFISRRPHLLVRRLIRGMLPYDRHKGKQAYKRIRCHIGVPKELEGQAITIEGANYRKMPHRKFVRISEISAHLGAPQ